MTQSGYPFQFIGTNTLGADQYLKETLVYAFKSEKSGHEYQVNLECYLDHLYCVKFFDHTPTAKIGKFSVLSGTYEPRTIFQTVADIALDVYRKDCNASFFFIGAADNKDKSGVRTRRYKVYCNFVHDMDLTELFVIKIVDLYSMCVLLNRKAVPDTDAYMQRLLDFIV